MNRILVLALAAAAAAAAIAQPAGAQQLYPIAKLSSSYGLAIDTTPAPAAFIGWCPTCSGHALIGPSHDVLVLTRNGAAAAHVGLAWLYAPGTTGNLATGGAAVAEGGCTIGAATHAALSRLPAAADVLDYSSPLLDAAGQAFSVDGFVGPRIGGANGIPKTVYGIGGKLSLKFSTAALSAIFGK